MFHDIPGSVVNGRDSETIGRSATTAVMIRVEPTDGREAVIVTKECAGTRVRAWRRKSLFDSAASSSRHAAGGGGSSATTSRASAPST